MYVPNSFSHSFLLKILLKLNLNHIIYKINFINYFKSEESFFSLVLLFDFKDDEESSKSIFGNGEPATLDALLLLVSAGNVHEDSLLFSSK